MKLYPLVYSFRDLIAGNGFVAAIAMDGRVLLSEEEGGFWMYGVQPGSVAAGASTRQAAFKEFKDGYLSVLFDIAAEATSFDEFESKVKAFFLQVNAPNAQEWEAALIEVRSKNISLSEVARIPAEARLPALMVAQMAPAMVNSGVNEFDQISEAA